MRIRTKLQIAFITTASIVAVSILSVSYFSMLTHFEQQEGKRLKLNVVQTAKAIDYFMFNRVADFNVLSNNPLFSTSSNDIISDYLLRVVNQYPFYEDLFFVNKNGIILSSSNKELIGANMLQLEPDIEDEFNKTISGGPNDVFISDVSNISQKEIEENAVLDLELLSDVIDLNENVVGVLVGSINIQILSELIFEIDDKIFDNENTYLVNDKGIVLISGNKEVEILQQHPDLFLKELQQKIENGENGFYIYKNTIDIKIISGYADLSEYGAERVGNWSLLSTTPYNKVMQPIYNMIYKAFFIFLFIILALFVLLIIFSGTFSKPIVELEKAVSDFGISGKPLNLKSTNKDEIGSLYESFNIMTENLYELSKKRDSAEHKLILAKVKAEESENHLRTILETEPECIKQLDAKGELIYMNPAGLAMIEADNLDMVKGQSMIGLITRNHQRAFKKLTNEVFNGNSGQLKFEIKGLKGTTRWLETLAVPFKDAEGNIISLLGVTRDITEHKKAEETIKESEERFAAIFKAAPGSIILTSLSDEKIVEVNDNFSIITGYSREEAIGETIKDLNMWTNPASRVRFLESIEKNGFVHDLEADVNHKSGIILNGLVSAQVITISEKKYLLGVFNDITERKKIEEEIRSAHQRLTTHLNNSPLAIIEWDKNFIIRNWSVQAKNIFGWEASEAVGKHFNDLNLIYEEDGAITAIIAEDLMLGKVKSNRNINRNYTKSKKVIYCEWYNSVLQSADAEIETIFSLVQDVTDRKNAEIELAKHRNNLERLVELRTNQFEKEKIKAQSADLMKSAFLATMSHELRTPMNSIIGFTGILLKELAGPLNNEQRRQLGMVKNSGQHLLGLINDVLDISKIEAGKLKVSIYYFNYLTTLEKTIDFLLPQAAKKELQIRSEISELNIILNSDERRVEQVLLNLLSNAIKFSNHGTITIKVDIVDGLVVTQVIDQGIGMSKKDLNKLFMPFIQLDGGLSRTHEGTGLGLAICKSLIEKLGGTIQVQSKVGKGSNFTFTLPLEYVNQV
ncbi:PAS domain S-box protein [Maribacter arcticus]|uniref:histidine kinase n=1 Tax=Maribacter arcticus TaxID=561365 RepID=A0A1T5CDY4_9FLAO|nr:PAS domain S-box protein [Maribacter arcticus]SKB57687.1 PAS domain S-box-containing protein [Maribacter arcticus]